MNQVFLMIESRPEHVPLAGACVKEMAMDYFSIESLTEIEQSLVELVNNCIEHAYKGKDSYQITIRYRLERDRLIIHVTDQGIQFDPKHLKDLTTDFEYDPMDVGNLPEGGFGLKIIKTCMDEVNYQRINDENLWSLTKYFLDDYPRKTCCS